MEPYIDKIEYIVPIPDKPIGHISFTVNMPVLHKAGQQVPSDNESANILISEETLKQLDVLAQSLINDLTK